MEDRISLDTGVDWLLDTGPMYDQL